MTRVEVLSDNVFHLTNGIVSYCIQAADDNVYSIYWGSQIDDPNALTKTFDPQWSSFDYEELSERTEFDIFDGRRYTHPCLKGEGDFRIGRMQRKRYVVTDDALVLVYSAYRDLLEVELHYHIAEEGVVERFVTLTALCADVPLTHVLSGAAVLPRKTSVWMHYTNGRWLGEWHKNRREVTPGTFVIESRKGLTGSTFNPSVLLTENETGAGGNSWAILLGYSGNWEMNVEKTTLGTIRISNGINSFDNLLLLEKGKRIQLPSVYLAYSKEGSDGAMQVLHQYERRHLIPKRKKCRVLYNSWEATGFNVNEESQMALAEKAAAIGCELFVVDDGWFSTRNNDHSGLGDWTISEQKFPHGLGRLIDRVKGLGMDFGIWVEPESVNPDSVLFRQHPDWIYHVDGTEPMQARNQYLLDIGKPEVKEYILGFMRKLLRDNDIRFIKWDVNRAISDPDTSESMDQRRLWYRHVESLYSIWKTLREEFPQVEFETCAGGGGRVDLGILRFAHQFWTSDNTNPYDRIRMQYSAMQFYSPSSMMSWVTDCERSLYSLDYRFIVSMCGGLGIGADISKFSDDELLIAKKWVEAYKGIRHLISEGIAYRIGVPDTDNLTAIEYVSEDQKEAVVFAFAEKSIYGKSSMSLHLRGLAAEENYSDQQEESYSGSVLMHVGLPLTLDSSSKSYFIHLRASC